MTNSLVDLNSSVASSVLAEIEAARENLSSVKVILDDDGARDANDALSAARALVKTVHDQRMAITRRVDAFKKSIISQETKIVSAVNDEIERVKSLQVSYLEDKRRAEEESRRAAEIEAAVTGESVKDGKTKLVDGVSSRETWTFDIVDADAVPRRYCKPDEQLIRRFMQDAKSNGAKIGELSIPGVSFRISISA